MASDTRKQKVKEGRTLAWVRAAAGVSLNCRSEVPVGT